MLRQYFRYQTITVASLILFLSLFHALTITKYPESSSNDGQVAARIKANVREHSRISPIESSYINLIPGGENLYSIFSPAIQDLPYYFFGKIDLLTVRATSLLLIPFCLILIFLIGKEIRDWKLGLIAVCLVGFSANFFYFSHLPRNDFLASILCLTSLYLVLSNAKNQHYKDLLAGIILVISLDIHPRTIVYLPLIYSLYIFKYRQLIFKNSNFWLFTVTLLSLGGLYFLLKILPYQEAILKLKKITISDSRTPTILNLDFKQFLESLKELFFYLNLITPIYWTIFLGLLLSIRYHHNSDKIISLFTLTLLLITPAIIPSFHILNITIIFPIASILVAHFIYKLIWDIPKNSKISQIFPYIGLAILLHFSLYNSLSIISSIRDNSCHHNKIEFINSAKKLIPTSAVMCADDAYWLSFQENPFRSFLTIKFLNNLKGYNTTEAMHSLGVDFLIYDRTLDSIITNDTPKQLIKQPLAINKTEFDNFLKANAKIVLSGNNKCDSTLALYQID